MRCGLAELLNDGLQSCDFAHKELLVSASACQQGPIASSLLPLMSRGLEHTLKKH